MGLMFRKKLLKNKAGFFSNFRGSDALLVRCKMALAEDPAGTDRIERLDRLESAVRGVSLRIQPDEDPPETVYRPSGPRTIR